MAKEIIISEVSTLPESLKKVAKLYPTATWNGCNVWYSGKAKAETLKSHGFTMAKNGKHAGQWFTNEAAQERLSKKVKKAVKSPKETKAEPKVEEPKAKETKVSNGFVPMRDGWCVIAEFDSVKDETHNINLIRVFADNLDSFKERFSKGSKLAKNITFRVVNHYKSDKAFKTAVKNMKDYKGKEIYRDVLTYGKAVA